MKQTQPTKQPTQNAANPAWPVSPLAGLLVVVIIYFVSQIVAATVLGGLSSDSTSAQFWYVVVVEALTLGMLYLFMRTRRLSFGRLGLLRPRLVEFGITLVAYPPYFILNAVAALSANALFHLNENQQQQTGFEAAKSTTDLVLTFISLVVLPPLVEEIVMRGFLFGSLKRGMSVVKAAVLTSAVFALAHLQIGSGAPPLWVAAVDTFVLSLVLCYLRQKSGSLWPGIGLHTLKNLIAFMVLFIFPHFHIAGM